MFTQSLSILHVGIAVAGAVAVTAADSYYPELQVSLPLVGQVGASKIAAAALGVAALVTRSPYVAAAALGAAVVEGSALAREHIPQLSGPGATHGLPEYAYVAGLPAQGRSYADVTDADFLASLDGLPRAA